MPRWLVLTVVPVLLAACADSESADSAPDASEIAVSSGPSTSATPSSVTPGASADVTEAASTSQADQLPALPVGPWRVGNTLLCLLEASTPEVRARGLMGVTEFSGGVDGMAFLWDADSESAFTMEGVLIPLDIAWFDVSGEIVPAGGRVVTTMQPCEAEDCLYGPPERPYRMAVEAAAGRLSNLTADSRMTRNREGCDIAPVSVTLST